MVLAGIVCQYSLSLRMDLSCWISYMTPEVRESDDLEPLDLLFMFQIRQIGFCAFQCCIAKRNSNSKRLLRCFRFLLSISNLSFSSWSLKYLAFQFALTSYKTLPFAASSDTTARLWSTSTGKDIKVYQGHHKATVCCALHDGPEPSS